MKSVNRWFLCIFETIIDSSEMQRIFLSLISFFLFSTCFSQKERVEIEISSPYERAKQQFDSIETTNGHFFESKHGRIHYYQWGSKKQSTLLWFHGSYSSGLELFDFLPELRKNGINVLCVEYYGHGSTPFPNEDLSIYSFVDDVKDLLGDLKLNKVIVGGWSRGGIIAGAFYQTYPSYVSALVLEDGGGASYLKQRLSLAKDLVNERIMKSVNQPKDPSFETEELAFNYFYDVTSSDSQFWWLGVIRQNTSKAWELNPGIAHFLMEETAEQKLDLLYRTSVCPLFPSSSLLFDPEIAYRNLTVPMLLFDPTGDDQDVFFALSSRYVQLKASFPHLITLVHYSDCGHAVHFSKPEAFQTELLHFIESVKK